MKYLVLLFLFLSTPVLANYIKQSDVGVCGPVKVFLTARDCGSNCIKINRDYHCKYSTMADHMVNDEARPNWATRSMVETCADEDDCKLKAKKKECLDGRWPIYNAEFTEVWCNKILSYEQKPSGSKIIVNDEAKKATHKAEVAAKKADQAAMAIASKALSCGKKVISRMLLQNKPKSLSKAQVRNLVKTYADIKNLLETGSLESARDDILAVAVNEPIVTQADKDALVAELDSCKP